jgi:hypothetical protein
VPHRSFHREPRNVRLLKLLLLQVAILSFTTACRGGRYAEHDEAPPPQPAPRPRVIDSRAVAESLKDSLDVMSEQMNTARAANSVTTFAIDGRAPGALLDVTADPSSDTRPFLE